MELADQSDERRVTGSVGAASWHRSVDHVSETSLELGAPTWPELLAEAARALSEELLRGQAAACEGPAREVVVEGRDREALLVHWLNELLFIAETEGWVPLEADVVAATATRLLARVRGAAVEAVPVHVKAATFHGLEVVERGGELTARVVIDT